MKLDPYLILKKINSRCVDLNLRLETIKLLEDKDIKLLNMALGNGFLDITPKAQVIKCKKNKQVGLYQTEKLLQRKRNCQQSKRTTLRMRRNICKPCIW